MISTPTINIFKTHQRYLRSTNLERDWHDPEALTHYVVTPQSRNALEKLMLGLRPQSSLRAWRVTGDYGSGKSSFALFAANVLSQRTPPDPELLEAGQLKISPILITGYRGALGPAILQGLMAFMEQEHPDSKPFQELQEFLRSSIPVADTAVLQWVKKAQELVVKSRSAAGIAIFLDEAGKFLEYASSKAEQEDIFYCNHWLNRPPVVGKTR